MAASVEQERLNFARSNFSARLLQQEGEEGAVRKLARFNNPLRRPLLLEACQRGDEADFLVKVVNLTDVRLKLVTVRLAFDSGRAVIDEIEVKEP